MKRSLILIVIAWFFTASANAENWYDKIKLNGGFYYRHELIDAEQRDDETGAVSDYQRNRHVIKARLSLQSEITPSTTVLLRLATGQPNPSSNAQTLDEGFSTKPLYIDLAYFEMKPDRIPNLSVTGGKIRNPFYCVGKSELIWDHDVNPEGMAASYTAEYQRLLIRLVASGLWIEERARGDDSYLAALQGMLEYRPDEKGTYVSAGASFFKYVNSRGYEPFFDETKDFGNSLDDNGHYLRGFELVELFGEVKYELLNQPVTVFGHFVTNTAAAIANDGWLAGVRMGKVDAPGSRQVRYMYRRLEKDAVIGIFTDWAFRHGGTDAKGHELGLDFQFAPKTTVALTYFDVKCDLADRLDFRKLHAQVVFVF
ncbi:MAG: putative porin [Candidatus Zixiibacteriota bacterium]|nr:MAG: putative porin [candidate division Zixibacteria bacterium]